MMFMRFVPGDGIAVRELQELTGFNDKEMRTWLSRMGEWWGYVVVETVRRIALPAARSSTGWSALLREAGRRWKQGSH